MFRLYHFIKQKKLVYHVNFSAGFTLIEILTAMTIIMIMIFAVSPLILFSVNSISDSGADSKSLISNRGNIEVAIAENDASEYAEIPVKFGSTPAAIVDGGHAKSGDISTFLPDAPTMVLNPSAICEGHKADTGTSWRITVTAKNTHFSSSATSLTVKNRNGNTVTGWTMGSITETTMNLYIPDSTSNQGSPYSIKITTNTYMGLELKQEVVRGELVVTRPFYFAVGENGSNLISETGSVSSSGSEWRSKSAGISNTLQLNRVIWGNDLFVCVANGGSLFTLPEGSDWIARTTGTTSNLNDIIWYNDQFIAVGNSGAVISSQSGDVWNIMNNTETGTITDNLFSIVASDSKIVAVGSNGAIYTYDTDVKYWTPQTSPVTSNLREIHWNGNVFIAVGDAGTIITSADGRNWTKQAVGLTSSNLQSVACGTGLSIAVGQSGTIISSTDGINWTLIPNTNQNSLGDIICFYDPIQKKEIYTAVGNNGRVITMNGTSISYNITVGSNNYRGLCHR